MKNVLKYSNIHWNKINSDGDHHFNKCLVYGILMLGLFFNVRDR